MSELWGDSGLMRQVIHEIKGRVEKAEYHVPNPLNKAFVWMVDAGVCRITIEVYERGTTGTLKHRREGKMVKRCQDRIIITRNDVNCRPLVEYLMDDRLCLYNPSSVLLELWAEFKGQDWTAVSQERKE